MIGWLWCMRMHGFKHSSLEMNQIVHFKAKLPDLFHVIIRNQSEIEIDKLCTVHTCPIVFRMQNTHVKGIILMHVLLHNAICHTCIHTILMSS